MNKEQFINFLDCDDKESCVNIYNDIVKAEKTNREIFTKDFITPNLWMKIMNLSNELNMDIKVDGIINGAQRKVISFNTGNYEIDFPIDLIKIKNKSKFIKLNHKDYLGKIMSLGIKREKLGDCLVNDDVCYVSCFKNLTQYFIDNIDQIGKCPVECEIYRDSIENIPGIVFKENVIDIHSQRADCVVSAIINKSRNEGVSLINKGMVKVDYSTLIEKTKKNAFGSTISIKGYGKFLFEKQIGITKRGNIKITVKKYDTR